MTKPNKNNKNIPHTKIPHLPPHLPPQLNLPTLHTKPSWQNRTGNTDRSAVCQLKASKIWPLIPPEYFKIYHKQKFTDTCPKNRQPAILTAQAEITINEQIIQYLNNREKPLQIRGDYRTTKSNAMKTPTIIIQPHATNSKPLPQNQNQNQNKKHTQQPNPNRGATQTKILALTLHQNHPTIIINNQDHLTTATQPPNPKYNQPWYQTFTIQRWQYPIHNNINENQADNIDNYDDNNYPDQYNTSESSKKSVNNKNHITSATRTQHFLLCPTCTKIHKLRYPPGTTQHNFPPKYTKLFLPYCTPEEFADAQIAQLYINSTLRPQNPNGPTSPLEQTLINRYQTLFPPRQFQCRHCLNLKYGEVKKTTK